MNLRENLRRSKEVLGAYWRQGLHELGSVFYGHGTAAQHPEYGMIATKPPGLVTEGLRREHSHAPSREDAAASRADPGSSQLEASLRAYREWSDREMTRDDHVRDVPEHDRE